MVSASTASIRRPASVAKPLHSKGFGDSPGNAIDGAVERRFSEEFSRRQLGPGDMGKQGKLAPSSARTTHAPVCVSHDGGG